MYREHQIIIGYCSPFYTKYRQLYHLQKSEMGSPIGMLAFYLNSTYPLILSSKKRIVLLLLMK